MWNKFWGNWWKHEKALSSRFYIIELLKKLLRFSLLNHPLKVKSLLIKLSACARIRAWIEALLHIPRTSHSIVLNTSLERVKRPSFFPSAKILPRACLHKHLLGGEKEGIDALISRNQYQEFSKSWNMSKLEMCGKVFFLFLQCLSQGNVRNRGKSLMGEARLWWEASRHRNLGLLRTTCFCIPRYNSTRVVGAYSSGMDTKEW